MAPAGTQASLGSAVMPRQTPQQFLLATPRGAYTTVYVKDRQLLNWPKHVERLEKSLSAMHTAIAGFYDAYYSSLAVRSSAGKQLVAAAASAIPPTPAHRRPAGLGAACRLQGDQRAPCCSSCWGRPSGRPWRRNRWWTRT